MNACRFLHSGQNVGSKSERYIEDVAIPNANIEKSKYLPKATTFHIVWLDL